MAQQSMIQVRASSKTIDALFDEVFSASAGVRLDRFVECMIQDCIDPIAPRRVRTPEAKQAAVEEVTAHLRSLVDAAVVAALGVELKTSRLLSSDLARIQGSADACRENFGTEPDQDA